MQALGTDHLNANGCKQNTVLTCNLRGLITSVRMAANRTQFSHATSGGWSPQCKWLKTEHSSQSPTLCCILCYYMQALGADHLNVNGCKENTVQSQLHFVLYPVLFYAGSGCWSPPWWEGLETEHNSQSPTLSILYYYIQALGVDHHLNVSGWKQNTVLSCLHLTVSCVIMWHPLILLSFSSVCCLHRNTLSFIQNFVDIQNAP